MIHIPHIGFLTGVVVFILVDEVHQEEEVVGKVVLLLYVDVETVGYAVKIVFAYTAYETVVSKLILNPLKLVSQSTKGVNDETLNDGQEDDNDKEEEGNVKEDSDKLIVGTVGRLNDVTNTATGAHTLVQMEHETSKHVVALLVRILSLLALCHVKLAEKVEGQDGVDVANDGEQADGEHQLLSVVGDGLQDDSQGGNSHRHVNQVGGKEEVVVVAEHGENKVEQQVEECLEQT